MQMPLAQGNVNDIDYEWMNNLLIFPAPAAALLCMFVI